MSNNHEGAPSGATENTGENSQGTPEFTNEKMIEYYNMIEPKANEIENDLDELEDINERIKELEAELEAHKEPDQPDGNNAEFLSPAVIKEPDVTDLTIYEARKKKIEALKEKAHKNKALGKVLLIAGIGALSLCLFFGFNGKNHRNESYGTKTRTESTIDDDREIPNLDDLTDSSGEQAEILGIYDGYGEKGMWLDNRNEKQSDSVNFANGEKVLEMFDGDVEEAVKYTAENEVEAFGAYLGCIPQEVKDYYGVGQTFQKNMTILEADEALERAPDSLYDKTKKEFFNLMDEAAEEREIVLNGWYDNAYMDLSDKNGSVDHKNMELVKCTTFETGAKATEFVWKDDNGNVLGSLIVKEACCQPVREKTSGPSPFDGMREIPNDPEHPDTSAPEPKHQTVADENSGATEGIVEPEGQERNITKEPLADQNHEYNSETNTYTYTPEDQAGNIGYEVTNDVREIAQESAPITAPEEIAKAEEAVVAQTAPEMVVGTQQGATGEAGVANNFDAGATIGTGEVTGNTPSSDGSGNTIQENLEQATGNEQANPGGDYSQGF
ncbi:hypothetical protein IKD49_00745 [Candidatus Saccharibacteria bacterium]|nr:hypothetical protein [Candidatus Saccharibacteria bacterium]MBR2995003.1 hypothetical protein [Candidatus Saccharibacteria bacterium]MBR2995046.1 hypothetical protein [Candidatus Saccharibacteria bacterium]